MNKVARSEGMDTKKPITLAQARVKSGVKFGFCKKNIN